MSQAARLRALIAERPHTIAELAVRSGLTSSQVRDYLKYDLTRGHVTVTEVPVKVINMATYAAPGEEPDLVQAQIEYHCTMLRALGVNIEVE